MTESSSAAPSSPVPSAPQDHANATSHAVGSPTPMHHQEHEVVATQSATLHVLAHVVGPSTSPELAHNQEHATAVLSHSADVPIQHQASTQVPHSWTHLQNRIVKVKDFGCDVLRYDPKKRGFIAQVVSSELIHSEPISHLTALRSPC
jgi:hypothetical protein